MHLCIDARLVHSSGIGTYLTHLIPKLGESFQLTLLVYDKKSLPILWLENFQCIELKAPIYSFKEQILLPLCIPACDLFWSPHYNVPVFPIRAKRKIVTIHDVFHLAYYSSLSFWQKIYAKKFLTLAATVSDHVVTVSNFSKDEILYYLSMPKEKISVIHNGVDPVFAKEDPVKKEEVQKRYNLPDQFFLFVSNMKPHKNHRRLILAFSKFLHQQSEDYYLVIAGKKDGFITGESLEEFLENMPEIKDKIRILGEVSGEDLPFIYQLSTAFVFPSLYEGFGLPALEAMKAGVPVIASDIPPIKEICQNNVFYVNPMEMQDIAKGLLKVAGDAILRRELQELGKTHSLHYNWQKSAEAHLTLFHKVSQL